MRYIVFGIYSLIAEIIYIILGLKEHTFLFSNFINSLIMCIFYIALIVMGSIIAKENTDTFEENEAKAEKRMGDKHMITGKISKVILIVVYVAVLVLQMVYFVPYEEIQVFPSKQNVPHTEVVRNGYASIQEISGYVTIMDNCNVSKRVDTTQLVVNVTLTTIIATAIYFLFIFKKETKRQHKQEEVELPYIDFNDLAFADDETQARARQEYAEAMYRYVKSKIDRA